MVNTAANFFKLAVHSHSLTFYLLRASEKPANSVTTMLNVLLPAT